LSEPAEADDPVPLTSPNTRRPYARRIPEAPMVRNFVQEFKQFALKGNMIDLAVAVVIGAAFGNVITSLVKNVITPLISYVTPTMDFSEWHIGKVMIGNLLNDLISFLFIALAVFVVIVKVVGSVMKKATPAPAPSEPITKECPLCLSTIPLKALKCSHCTADLPVTGTTAA
jgi:large conductance mechanosensitive channel